MAETNINKYSARGRLGRMDVDLIDVEPTVDTSAYQAGDLMFNPIKIENCVSVSGGRALLHSVAVANDDALTGSFDLIFTESDDALGTLNNAVAGESGLSDANADSILGRASITNMVDVGGCSIGSVSNVGLVLKAPAGSKDIYVWGIEQSTNNPTSATGYKLRIGVIKD